jgi:hypothetical protein
MEDLELLHHFSTTVYLTLSDGPAIRTMWQIELPKVAIAHPCLMHSILGISALHLVHYSPERNERYRKAAVHHQDTAVAALRALLQQVDSENCDAICATATLTALFAAGLHQTPGSESEITPLEGLLEVGELGRGVHVVINAAMKWIRKGSMAPMVNLVPWDFPPPLAPDIVIALQELDVMVSSAATTEADKMTYLSSIRILKQTFDATALNAHHPPIVFSWLVFIDRNFFNMIKEKDPISLVILSHYGVVLQGSAQQWWSDNWGLQILKLVAEILEQSSLQKYLPMLAWPARRVKDRFVDVQSFIPELAGSAEGSDEQSN